MYKFTPDVIDRLTLQQTNHYMAELSEYYGSDMKPAETSLADIRAVLFSFFGVDTKAATSTDDTPVPDTLPRYKVTKAAMLAFEKAGYPENPGRFFREFDNADNAG